MRTVVRRTADGKETVFSSQEGAADHHLDQQHNNGTKTSEATLLKQGQKVGLHEWTLEVGFHEWGQEVGFHEWCQEVGVHEWGQEVGVS